MTDPSDRIITRQELEGVSITAATQQPGPLFSVGGNGTPQVTLHRDGRLEFSGDHTLDETARAFWEAVQRATPDPMTQEFGAPLKARINAELAAGEKAQRRLEQARALHKETCPLAKGELKPNAFSCSMCDALGVREGA
jgi:hypothetical protein